MKRIAIPAFFTCLLTHTSTIAQVTNPDFETTTTGGSGTVPTNWVIGSAFGAGLSSDSHSGSNAIQVWNWYYYGPGYVSNGNSATSFGLPMPGEPFLYNGEPISFKPYALTGYYKYDTTLNGGTIDSGVVQITLSKYNTSTNLREAVGFGEVRLAVINNYTAFNVPVNYTSAIMPDTVVVAIRSSVNGFCSMTSSGTCLYLTVDDLALSTGSGLVDFDDKNLESKAYPNPANNLITIEAISSGANITQCVLTTLTGSVVSTQPVQNNKASISVKDLSPGFYLYQLNDANGTTQSKGKVQVVH